MRRGKRYHASTEIGKQQLIEFEYKAKNQEESVIAIFRRFKRPMTPSEVWACLEYTEWPLTSVRRAMSNLQEAGKLEIMKKTKKGIYGRPEHYYKTRYMSRRKEIN